MITPTCFSGKPTPPPPPLPFLPQPTTNLQSLISLSQFLKLVSISLKSPLHPPKTAVTIHQNLQKQEIAQFRLNNNPLMSSNPYLIPSHFHGLHLNSLNIAPDSSFLGLLFALFVGLPVVWFGSVAPGSDPLRRVLTAVSSGLFVVTLAVVRMYLGWAYVGNRLLSATVEYEETGWYDGQIWVKTAEVLARDRLLGSFSVKPVLTRLKNTLVILATSLFVCAVILINSDSNSSQKDPYGNGNSTGPTVTRVYNDESARAFEPDAFCGGDSGVPR